MADVFISYKHRMRPQVAIIANELKALGLDVWYDEGLVSGNDYAAVISINLRAAKSVLVCWTDDAFPHAGDRNGWVRGEAEKARERGVLVAATLEDKIDLDPPWNMVQYSDLSTWHPQVTDRGAWRNMLRGIGGLVGRPGLAALDEAQSAGTSEALTAWAREYSDDPLVPAVWAKITELAVSEARAKIETERLRPKVVMTTPPPIQTRPAEPATTHAPAPSSTAAPPPTTAAPQPTAAPVSTPAPAVAAPLVAPSAVVAGRRPLSWLLVPTGAGMVGGMAAAAMAQANGNTAILVAVFGGMAVVAALYAWALRHIGALTMGQAVGFFAAMVIGTIVAFLVLFAATGNISHDPGEQSGAAFFFGALGAIGPLVTVWLLTGRRKPVVSIIAIVVGFVLTGYACGVTAAIPGNSFTSGNNFLYAAVPWHLLFGLTILWLVWLQRRAVPAAN